MPPKPWGRPPGLLALCRAAGAFAGAARHLYHSVRQCRRGLCLHLCADHRELQYGDHPYRQPVSGDLFLEPNMAAALSVLLMVILGFITAVYHWLLKRSYHAKC